MNEYDQWHNNFNVMLSSIANENAINDWILCCCSQSKSEERSEILSAIMFSNRLTLAKACLFPGHTILATFSMQIYTKAPMQYGSDSNAISLALRQLAFTAAWLICHFRLKADCYFFRSTGNLFTFLLSKVTWRLWLKPMVILLNDFTL